MSIDKLHDRVRKLKSPVVLDMTALPGDLPPHLMQEESSYTAASMRFCRELMAALKETVCGVRFSFDQYALMGSEGLETLSQLITDANQAGYYVFLDGPQILSPAAAELAAQTIFGSNDYPCDALILSPYIGSDAMKPFLAYCAEGKKALFPAIRTGNKSASELQDLLSGSRQVHTAAADIVNRLGEISYGKCGYSRVGALASATAANSLKNLRTNYKRLYLFVDGMDYPSANAKNCSAAFDRFGHGAVVCAGISVTAAWKEAESDGNDYIEQATMAADRLKRNVNRYITIL